MLGEKGKDAVDKDREVVRGIEAGNKGFGKYPQNFNGPLGFAYFEWLDDASRNAVLCAVNASTQASMSMLDGHADKARDELRLSESCSDVSTLLYTVSENAGALYTRYVQGEEQLAQYGAEVAEQCAAALKQQKPTPKQ